MPPENGQDVRASVEAAYRALNAGDLDAFVSVAAEDVEFTSLVAEAEGTIFRGHAGVRAWWEKIRGAFGDASWELLDVNAVEDRAVVHIRIAGTLGGVPVEQSMWQAVKAREGKVRWWALYRTEAEALDAVGLDE